MKEKAYEEEQAELAAKSNASSEASVSGEDEEETEVKPKKVSER